MNDIDNIKLSAVVHLKSLMLTTTGDTKMITSKLIDLMRQPLATQMRKIIA